jgi:hypothetical protein
VEQRRENIADVWAWIGTYDVAWARAGRLFTGVQLTSLPTVTEHTAEELNALLGTMSFYAPLSPDQRRALRREN